MTFEEWEASVPVEMRHDPIWTLRVYRAALYAGEIGRHDADRLGSLPRYADLADQLCRATESISSNIAEGHGRESPKDRARFYEYAAGSARESRDWYYKARTALGAPITSERLASLTSNIRITTALVRKHRPTPK